MDQPNSATGQFSSRIILISGLIITLLLAIPLLWMLVTVNPLPGGLLGAVLILQLIVLWGSIWLLKGYVSRQQESFKQEINQSTEYQQQLEAQLQANQELNEQMFQEVPVMYTYIFINDEDVPLVEHCNQHFLKRLGYTREEVIDQPLANFYHPDSRDVLRAEDGNFQYTLDVLSGSTGPYPRRLLTKDGETVDTLLQIEALRNEQGRFVRTRALYVDITDRKLVEQALLQSQADLEVLFNSIPFSFTFLNPDATIRMANAQASESAYQIYGRKMEAGAPIYDFMDPAQHEQFQLAFGSALAGNTITTEQQFPLPNGDVIYFELRISPIHAGADIAGVCIAAENVTARKLMTRELETAKESAEAASYAKSRFLANMSHELRTPLNAIIGFAQLLNQTAHVDLEQAEYIRLIHNSGEQLLDLINSILELSKIEAGQQELVMVEFNLLHLFDKLAAIFRARAHDKGLEFIYLRPDNIPHYAYGDQGKIRQIATNLLANALKFTEVGSVTLELRFGSLPANQSLMDHSHARGEAGLFSIRVADTGPGIDPEEQSRLFEPFAQTSSGQQLEEGTGLGLTICYEYAQLMGGNMGVVSAVGVGSTFASAIPLLKIPPPDLPAPDDFDHRVTRLAPGQPEYRLLIVDDKVENRLVLERFLSKLGFAIREATNGQEALDIWYDWQPHLVWLDMRMPVIDGYQTARAIRKAEKGTDAHTILIALTASVFRQDESDFLAAGCDGFITKPYRIKEIVTYLSKFLDVEFEYDSSPTGKDHMIGIAEFSEPPLSAADRSELRRAAARLDDTAVTAILESLQSTHPTVTRQYQQWVDAFNFERLLSALEEPSE